MTMVQVHFYAQNRIKFVPCIFHFSLFQSWNHWSASFPLFKLEKKNGDIFAYKSQPQEKLKSILFY